MTIASQCLPGMNLGFSQTYTDQNGALRSLVRWMRCERVDHQKGVVEGYDLNSRQSLKVGIGLIHTSNSPYQAL